jgi:ketosteroid isomerase-like protein
MKPQFDRPTQIGAKLRSRRKWTTGSRSIPTMQSFCPPNDKKATGKEDVRRYFGQLLMLPGLSLSWEPSKVEVARSGDLAYTQGSYRMAFPDPHGKPATDQGKTLEVWRKQADGSWKCVADMWSSDLPATPQ